MADEETPSFGDVVAKFTPPGTDFDEFKKALHSQGAPGAINPEFVAMLNKAAAVGAIPGGLMAQSGTTCVRCDHAHGGPPGQACLEAEAQYGRAYLRRRPDVQLDAISGPKPQVSAYQDTDATMFGVQRADFVPTASVAAISANEMFRDFMAGGFTEDQALKLTAFIITSHNSDT